MKLLSQRDKLWGKVKLGRSELTCEKFGCTTTGLSMLSDYFGCFLRPDDIARMLDWYTPTGLILWTKLNFSRMVFVRRFYKFNAATINLAIKDPNLACMLEVDGNHWVVAVSKLPFVNVYRIADPWDSKIKFSTAYKPITGGAIFRKKTE
jgi:hypothetical protein